MGVSWEYCPICGRRIEGAYFPREGTETASYNLHWHMIKSHGKVEENGKIRDVRLDDIISISRLIDGSNLYEIDVRCRLCWRYYDSYIFSKNLGALHKKYSHAGIDFTQEKMIIPDMYVLYDDILSKLTSFLCIPIYILHNNMDVKVTKDELSKSFDFIIDTQGLIKDTIDYHIDRHIREKHPEFVYLLE